MLTPNFNTRFIDERTDKNSREWFRYLSGLAGAGVIADMGSAVLVAGTVTVNSAFANSGNEFSLTAKVAGGTQGFLSIGAVTDNTSFVINSSDPADTSTVSWMILKAIT